MLEIFVFIGFLLLLVIVILCLLLNRQGQLNRFVTTLQSTFVEHNRNLSTTLIRMEERGHYHQTLVESVNRLLSEQQQMQQKIQHNFDSYQLSTLQTLQESLRNGIVEVSRQVTEALNQHAFSLNNQFTQLSVTTDQNLKEISGQVEKRLSEGFEKTTTTFTNVMTRLALIDEAQKKMMELSANIDSLQNIFTHNKQSRGIFGEVQLADLLHNGVPKEHVKTQPTLSNGKRPDFVLMLPGGGISIDSKFPLENYRRMVDAKADTQSEIEQLFKRDIRKHIQDIADKYIVVGETADSAIMFIPAEAIFAEIHARHPDLVEISQKIRVWIVSPTTLWAVLNTARAVIKDAATRKQVHIIQKHLQDLGTEFERFKVRIAQLSKHISQAQKDTEEVCISSRKISDRFNRIEKVELTKKIEEIEEIKDTDT